MKREILINGTPRETRVAILEDDRLVELLVDRPDHRRMVGDIYLGRVEAVLPGIQAAFVDIGLEKSAFLHASDLLEPDDEHDPDDEPEEVADSDGSAPGVGEADVPRSSRRRRRRGRGNASSAAGPVEGGEGAPGGDEGGEQGGDGGFDGGDEGAPDDGVPSDGPEAGTPGAEAQGEGQQRRGRRGRRRGRRRGKGRPEGQNGGVATEDGTPLDPNTPIAGLLAAPRGPEEIVGELESVSGNDGAEDAQRPSAPAPQRQRQQRPSKQQQKQERREKAKQQQQQRQERPQGQKSGREQSQRPSASAPERPRQREVGGRRHVPDISTLIKKGDTLLVQVTKEPISTKGSRVTAQISLAGRFLVYMPYASKVGVSRKIESREERVKLREMVGKYLPKDSGGMIVRTVAEGTTEEHFKREVESLLGLWKKINKKTRFVRAPALVQRETSLTRGIIRDLFSAKVDSLHCDSKELHHEIGQYLEQVDPALMDRVKLYQEPQPLFEKFDIEREIRDLFKARCDLPNGGSIVIQPTEALTSIDVNTGRYTGKKDPEKTILRTNLEAAREIARQLRLRDIGGIIVCDFIDMETRSNKDRVLQELRQHLGRDRARTKAHAVSELGLVEMTRQRVRPSLWHSMTADCPTCTGTGRVFRPEVVARRLERSLKRVGYEHRERQLAIRLHPEVALYLLEEEPKLVQGLGRQTGIEFEVRDDPMMR
ncbi:MAG TPA: Rne/Rng family ribonuclease, partial [Gemmatimonadales bacterium]|nr:Rne/Rng family ribonuclease [Gemmatimonadales bacterium]